MKNIVTVGYQIPGHSDLAVPYSSNKSLLDSDLIVFCSDFEDAYDPDYGNSSYQGKILYSESDSFELKEDTNHWKQELQIFLESGRNVFLILTKFENFFLHTGQKTYSGTGRNSRATNIVSEYDNYQFVPGNSIRLVPTTGKEIKYFGDSLFLPFWTEFKNFIEYQNYIESDLSRKIMVTKTGEKVVAGTIKVAKGNLILLPYINQPENFTKYDKEKKQSFWTEKGIVFGEKLLQIILDIDKGLTGDITPPPEWLNQDKYITTDERKLMVSIEKINNNVDTLLKSKTDQLEKIQEEQILKQLLFETGKPLENSIILALKILGYQAENVIDDDLELDQVLISPEGDRYIGEAEGKDNSQINIDKLRQLSTNLQEDLQREEVKEIATGILFGNGFRLMDPDRRIVQFTDKCISTAKKTGVILIDTSSLYKVSTYVKTQNDSDFAIKCRETLKKSVGEIVSFPEIPTPSK